MDMATVWVKVSAAAMRLTQEELDKLAMKVLNGIKRRLKDGEVFSEQPDKQKALNKLSLVLPIRCDPEDIKITQDIEYLADYDTGDYTIGVHAALLTRGSKGIAALLRKKLTHEILHYIDHKINKPKDYNNDVAHIREFWMRGMALCKYPPHPLVNLRETLLLIPKQQRKAFIEERVLYLKDQVKTAKDDRKKDLIEKVKRLESPTNQNNILGTVDYMEKSGHILSAVDLGDIADFFNSDSGELGSNDTMSNKEIIKGPHGGRYYLIDPDDDDIDGNRVYVTSATRSTGFNIDELCEFAGTGYLLLLR